MLRSMLHTRRQLLLAALAQLVPLRTLAQGPGRPRRVGVLTGTNERFFARSRAAFEAALVRLGWSPGADLLLTYRHSVGDETAAYRALTELLDARVELLVSAGAIRLQTLHAMVTSLPVVALFDADPVASGLAASMARPGGQVTGVVALAGAQETAKMMETIREAFPRMRNLGLLYQGDNAYPWREERSAAAHFGIDLVPMGVAGAGEIDATLATIAARKVDAVWVINHPTWSIPAVAQALRKARVAAISDVVEFAEAGGLLAFGSGVEMVAAFHQLARFVDRILRGASPGTLPIESPASPTLVVNMRTAREMGYKPPAATLLKAGRLIE